MRHRIAAVRVLPLSARASGTSVATPFVAVRPNLLSYLRRPCLRVARAAVESRLFLYSGALPGSLVSSSIQGGQEGRLAGPGREHGEGGGLHTASS